MSVERRPALTSGIPLLFLALLVATVTYTLALEEEPYHIDELRQTRAYHLSIGEVVDQAFAQDQPPLDPVVNSLVQRVIGVADWKQRLIPALAGVGAIAILGLLCLRSGLEQGAGVGAMVMTGSALLTSVFVYARPYALPSFLMMLFLFAVDRWLRERRIGWALALFPLAVALPLSRTLEPLLVLAISTGILLVYRLIVGRRFQGSVWVPVSAAVTGALLSGIPVISRLRNQLGAYTQDEQGTIAERLARLVTDVPEGLGRVFPYWPVLLVVIALVLMDREARHWMRSTWWFWVVLFLPVAFTAGFVVSVNPDQPLFDRYFFTWVPAISVLSALAWEHRPANLRLAAGVTIGLLLGWMAWTQWIAFSTNDRGDWRALSEAIASEAMPDSFIVVEHAVPLGRYRPFYYGQPRYLPSTWSTQSPITLIRDPGRVPPAAGPLVLALSGPRIEVDGWRSIPIDGVFTLFLPARQPTGPTSVADGLATFASALGPGHGETLGVAAASVYAASGHIDRACEIIEPIRMSEDLAQRLQRVLETEASPLLELECPN